MQHERRRPARPGMFLLAAGAAFLALSVAGVVVAAVPGGTPVGEAAGEPVPAASPMVPPAASFVAASIAPPAPVAGEAPSSAETAGQRPGMRRDRAEARQERRRVRRERDGDRRDRARARRGGRGRDRRSAAPFGTRGFRSGRFDSGRALLSYRLAERLELTEAQRDELRDLFRELGDERREGRRALADARRKLARALRDDARPAEEVRTLGEAVGRLQAEQGLRRRTDRERVSAVLTDEQRARWAEMRQGRRGDRDRAGENEPDPPNGEAGRSPGER